MMKFFKFLVLISCLLLISNTIYSAENNLKLQNQLSKAQWQQDIELLTTKIKRHHPNPWRTISELKFQQHLEEIILASANQSRQQTIAQLLAAVSMITRAGSDGQTGLWPLQQETGFHILPLRLYWFTDGIYVVATDISNQELEGQRLTAIAGRPIEQVIEKIRPYVSHENANWLKSWIPLYALIPELLESLKLSEGLLVAITTENKNAESSTRQIKAITSATYKKTFPEFLNNVILPVSSAAPLYLQNVFEQQFWFRKINEKTLYLQYNQIVNVDKSGLSFSDFINLAEIEIKKYQLTSLILDIRNNGGGENASYVPFFEMFDNIRIDHQPLDLYVLIGRATFSTAVNFLNDLANRTDAIFVGEPTGGSPDQYTNPEKIILPNSKLTVQIATEFVSKTVTQQSSLTHQPDFLIELRAADYFSKKDPALKKILYMIELKSFE